MKLAEFLPVQPFFNPKSAIYNPKWYDPADTRLKAARSRAKS